MINYVLVAIVLFDIFAFALLLADKMSSARKVWWGAVIILIPFAGPLLYLFLGRIGHDNNFSDRITVNAIEDVEAQTLLSPTGTREMPEPEER